MKTISIGFFLQRLFVIYIALSTIRLSTARMLGNETDKLALLDFKNQITPDSQGVMSSWNDSLHLCEWKGITCGRRHQRVIALDLMSQGLIGSISPYIGNLSFLQEINLGNNTLHGEIPEEIGRLLRLKALYMGNNSLTGQIPVNLSHCSSLINLVLAYNKLVGRIPVELGYLRKLTRVGLHVNNLTGRIPSSFGNLSSLELLSLSENNLTESIPDSLGQLKRMTFLDLSTNMISGMVPPSFYNISSLQIVSFALNQFEGTLPHDMGTKLPNLQIFWVGANRFSGSIPISFFTNASGLQSFELAFNGFTGKVPVEVGSLKGLQLLNLERNYLGSGGKTDDLDFVSSLANCSNLQTFSIAVNHFGGRLPSSIANLSKDLNSIHLGENKLFGSIPEEISNLVNLVALYFDHNSLTGTIPKSIGMLQNLQRLSLQGNKFSGQVPSSIGNISQLYDLDLSDNILEGNIISSIENCQFLESLNLSYNHFSGTIPKEVLGRTLRLKDVSLSHNSLSGSLPSEVGNLETLRVLDISDNKISGEIPDSLANCINLENLYLQGNFLQGPIPSSLGLLKGIQDVDLSRNKLSGQIPKDLGKLFFLRNLNLSFNDFEGEVPIARVFRNVSAFSIVGNKKLCGGIPILHLRKCHVKKSKGIPLAWKITVGLLVPSFIIAFLYLAIFWKRKQGKQPSSEQFLENRFKRVSYNELFKATNGFSSENLIGIGSYGSVYKGVIHQDEGPIAVKVLNLMEQGASKSFVAECEVLRKVRHRNLLKILTVCSSQDFEGNDFKALVFEIMPNGSVENWLHPSSNEEHLSRNLNFMQRLDIAADVAFALDYLHSYSQTPIVHCDLKPSNVLLDNDMVAYVGDFGLAKCLCKITSNSEISETSSISVRGTIGYIPPEYGMGAEVTTQGDVYSYGILVLEMFTAKKPTDVMFKEGLSLHHYSKMAIRKQVMDIIDKSMWFEGSFDEATNDSEVQNCTTDEIQNCLISIVEIGVACSSESVSERMDIKDVLKKLSSIRKRFSEIRIQKE